MDKKKKLWGIVIICLLLVGVVLVGVYQVHARNAQKKETIENAWQTFEGEKNREKRLLDYQDFAQNESLTMDAWYDKIFSKSVKSAYDAALSDMRQWFTDDYDKIYKENSISLEATTENKEDYENAKMALTSLQETIQSDKVLSKKESKTYQKKIAQKMTDYDTALTTIAVNEKKAYYDALISDNTFDDVDSISSKSKLNTAISNLTDVLNAVKAESVFDTDTVSAYETNINNLISIYNTRISAIEESEKQAASKAKRNSNGSTNGNNGSSGSSNSTGSSSSGNSDHWTDIDPRTGKPYWMNYSYTYIYDPETGEIWTYKDNAGNTYDDQFNLIG